MKPLILDKINTFLENLPHVKVPYDKEYPFISGCCNGAIIVYLIITIYLWRKN
jgi:hypothetical protein